MRALTPAEVLFDGEVPPAVLPACDHYAGSEKLMLKSLALQQQLGPVFDITLDCEDGAQVGREAEHAELVASLLGSEHDRFGRVGVRIHDFDHRALARRRAPHSARREASARLHHPAENPQRPRRRRNGRVHRGDAARTRHRAAGAGATAGRNPRRAHARVRSGRAAGRRSAELRPDGLRLRARRRDSRYRHALARASSIIRWCGARSSRFRRPVTRTAKCRRTTSARKCAT